MVSDWSVDCRHNPRRTAKAGHYVTTAVCYYGSVKTAITERSPLPCPVTPVRGLSPTTAAARDSARDDGPDRPVIADHGGRRNRALAAEEGGSGQAPTMASGSWRVERLATAAGNGGLETRPRLYWRQRYENCAKENREFVLRSAVRLCETTRFFMRRRNRLTAGTRLRKMGGHVFTLSSEPRAPGGTLRA